VGIGKASVSESLMKCRKLTDGIETGGVDMAPGLSLADTRLLARWCPAWRRRESDLLLSRGTWEGESR